MMYLKVLDSYNQEQTIQWHTGETFPENYYDLAIKNLLQGEIREYAVNLRMDGELNYKYIMAQVQSKYY